MNYKKSILGISSNYHDSSAALLSDGNLIAFCKEERFTRIKHDASFPEFAIKYCLDKAKLKPDEIDIVVYYEEPAVKFSRVLISALAEFPFHVTGFIRAIRTWLTDRIWIQNEICAHFEIHPSKVRFIPHHVSHAAQCFFVSPFMESAILTIDAVGEWNTVGFAYGTQLTHKKIVQLDCNIYPHSLGLLYSAFTSFLGFEPNSQECNTMALAAFGKPTYIDNIYKIVSETNGNITVDQSYFHFLDEGNKLFSKKFIDLFGSPRNSNEPLPFDIYESDYSNFSEDHLRFADIARSIQDVLEELLLKSCLYLYSLAKSDNLCIAGGVALNVAAISKIHRFGPFKNIYIPPDPGDGGAAIGAALAEYYKDNAAEPIKFNNIQYLGEESYDLRFVEMLKHLNAADVKEYLIPGVEISWNSIEVIQNISEVELLDTCVSDLKSGRILAWFQGRAESGPRALGNRSILADPGNIQTAIRLSKKIKLREAFRPYAISVTPEDLNKLFEPSQTEGIDYPLKWMQITLPVLEEFRSNVKAAIHIDGTVRPQVCSLEDNPGFYKLLRAYGLQSGISALLNTSFNEKGYPLVNTPDEALLSFLRTDIDTLVINDVVIRKK